VSTKSQYIRDLLDKALDTKIPVCSPEDFERIFGIKIASREEIEGMTLAEVMVRQLVLKACAGNDKSIQEVMDRLLGKPVQLAEVKSVSFTYQDYLDECMKKDAEEAGRPLPAPVSLSPPDPVEDLLS